MLFDIFIYWIIIPLLFILILFFDFILMMGQENVHKRIQVIAGGVGGFLIAIVFIMLDDGFGGVFPKFIDSTLDTGFATFFIMLFLGFSLLFIVDLLLRRKVVPFIVMGTIMGISLAIYQLTATQADRTITGVGAISFLVGVIIYYMMFGERVQHYIANAFRRAE